MQSDPDAAVQLLVVRQLEGFAKAGKRVAPGEKEVQGGQGGSLEPPGLFLRASVRILVGARGVFCVPSHPRGPPFPWLRAAAPSQVVLLMDALDEADERGGNPAVQLLRELGQARTGLGRALGLCGCSSTLHQNNQ